jgi:hypothetical protein
VHDRALHGGGIKIKPITVSTYDSAVFVDAVAWRQIPVLLICDGELPSPAGGVTSTAAEAYRACTVSSGADRDARAHRPQPCILR